MGEKFIKRLNLQYSGVRGNEGAHIDALTNQHGAEHLPCVSDTMKRYNIREAWQIFNMDETGHSFKRLVERSLRKVIGPKGRNLTLHASKTKGNLESVTVMPVLSASGTRYKPVVMYTGKQVHYRKVRGILQTIHSFLLTALRSAVVSLNLRKCSCFTYCINYFGHIIRPGSSKPMAQQQWRYANFTTQKHLRSSDPYSGSETSIGDLVADLGTCLRLFTNFREESLFRSNSRA